MAERSFAKEVEALKARRGRDLSRRGILAVTKALLQSGVAYVGGYQGAPVSHLLDVLVDAEDIMAELGVHLETCTNEASGRRDARRLDQLPLSAARSPGSRSSAPTWRPMRCRTSPRPA
jgi:indolepyruvate ferredoxin oxidoreductase alpha subunit